MTELDILGATFPTTVAILGLGASLALVLAAVSRGDAFFVRGLGLLVVGLAGVSAWGDATAPALDAGRVMAGGSMVRDHLAGTLDLVALAVTAVALVGSGRGEGASGSAGSVGPARRLGAEPLALAACTGVSIVFHAGDLLTLFVGAELASVSAVGAALVESERGAARALLGPAARQLSLGAIFTGLGVALIYAATSSLAIHGDPQSGVSGLGGRLVSVFTQWGAVQSQALALENMPADRPLPSGVIYQFKSKVVTGMAPAALFIPGMLALLVGALGRTLLLPFGGLSRRLMWSSDHGAGVSVLAGVLTPLVGFGILLRVFVGVLHAARLVREPYGWVGPLPLLALLTAILAGAVAVRQRDAMRIVGWLATGTSSLIALLVVTTASFAGRGTPRGAVTSAFERDWARVATDLAHAATLMSLVGWAIASAALVVGLRVLAPESTDLVAIARAARRDRGLGVALAVAAVSLLGLPPLVGGLGLLSGLRAVLEHSSLRLVLPGLAVGWALMALAAWRLVLALVPTAHAEDDEAEVARRNERPLRGTASTNPGRANSRAMVLAIGLFLSLGGLWSAPLSDVVEVGASGVSLGLGSDDRAAWIGGLRVTQAERRAMALADPRVESAPDPDADPSADPEAASGSKRKAQAESAANEAISAEPEPEPAAP